jgi:trimeric autotransporter adhesin
MGFVSFSKSRPRSINRRLQELSSVAILLTFALAVGCRGFFVNPKLTSISVTPSTVTISKGQTQQLTATGNYDDGSTKDLTGSVSWSSSDTTCATVSSTGLVTASASITNTCTATITATSGSLTASATITATPGTLVSIALTVNNGLTAVTVPAGSTVTFKALGTYSGSSTQQDITTQVTWTVSNTTVLTINQGSTSGTVSSSATSGSTATVTAALSGITSNQVTITVQ